MSALPAPVPSGFPLTAAQREVRAAAARGALAARACQESVAVALRGALSAGALQSAAAALVARHEALRLAMEGDTQRIRDAGPVPLPEHDLSALPAGGREAAIHDRVEEEALAPFDLSRGPLVRFRLLRLGPERSLLLVTAHAVACDRWSLDILLEELGALTARARHAVAAPLPPAPSFLAFALGARRREASGALALDAALLARLLVPLGGPLRLPADRPRGSGEAWRAGTVHRLVSGERARAVRRLGASHACSFPAALLAVFTALLHRLTGAGELLVGVPAPREGTGWERLVANASPLLPLRSRAGEETLFSDHLRETGRALRRVADHRGATLGSVAALLGAPVSLPVSFEMERMGAGLRVPGLSVAIAATRRRALLRELSLRVMESDDGLLVLADHADHLDGAAVARWLEEYEALLEAAVAEPRTRLLDLLPAPEVMR